VSVFAQNVVLLFSRGFYSAGKTREPLIANIASSLVIIISAPLLLWLYNNNEGMRFVLENILRIQDVSHTEIIILAMAFSLGMIINAVVLWSVFEKTFSGFSSAISKNIYQSAFASLILGVVTYYSLNIFNTFIDLDNTLSVFAHGFISGSIGLAVWAGILLCLKNEEMSEVIQTLRSRLKAKPVSDQTVE